VLFIARTNRFVLPQDLLSAENLGRTSARNAAMP